MTTNVAGQMEIRNLSVFFGEGATQLEAVSDVSMDVLPGTFVSIVGPSGCGKSTLLNVVAGFVKASAGSVHMDGKLIQAPGADRGMVFQQYSLFPWKTVRENVEFGLKMKGIESSRRMSAARTLLGLAGLLAFENHYPDQLSGGMKQRVGIVRALATSPQVLLMDEPFGALDSQTRAVMQQILTNMWQRLRISVLFITHDIDESIFVSDKIYVMTARPGKIKAVLDVDLPRPRDPSMCNTPAYLALRRQLHELIREESLKAMGGELSAGGLEGLAIDVDEKGLGALV